MSPVPSTAATSVDPDRDCCGEGGAERAGFEPAEPGNPTQGLRPPAALPQRGRSVAFSAVDRRAPNDLKLALRASHDNGATWSAEIYPFGVETFDNAHDAPRLVAARDGQTLYVFSWPGTGVPRFFAYDAA